MMNTQPSQTPSETLSIQEATALLGASRPAIDKLVECGLLTKYRRPGGWYVYFRRAEVIQLKRRWREVIPGLARDRACTLIQELSWHRLVKFVDAALEDPAGNTSGDPSLGDFEIAETPQMTGARLEHAVDRIYEKWQTQTQVRNSFTREQVKQSLLSALVDMLEHLAWSPKDGGTVTDTLDVNERSAGCELSAHHRTCLPATAARLSFRIGSVRVG